MKDHCPICDARYGLFDRLTQPAMCATCYKEARSLPASTTFHPNEPDPEDEALASGIGKFMMRFAIRIVVALIFVPLILLSNHLSDTGSKYAGVVMVVTIIGILVGVGLSFLLPVMVFDERMSLGQAIRTLTLFDSMKALVASVRGAARRKIRSGKRNPFLEE